MSEPTTGARRALIIGINTYARLPPRYQLDGCRNDALLMRSVLLEKFGFAEPNVRLLLDEAATRDAILEALDALVEETGDDDIVVVHYAGHGSQVRDREDDEGDGRDETIVPCDAGRPPEPNRDITDDEIHLRLLRLGEKTRNITLIFDCCHSGTISRDLDAAKARQLEADPRPPAELPPSPLTLEDRSRLAAIGARGPAGWFPIADRYVLISGCRDDERSYEHTVDAGEAPVQHGALTFFLTRALLEAVPGTTYRDVFDAVAAQVTAARAEQHPQIEGTLDREIFGVRDIEPMRYVRVAARETGSPVVELAAGAAHGLTRGSTWNVHEPGAKQALDESRLGTIGITGVRATRADARITAERAPDAIRAGARAVETAHQYGEMRMAVRIEGDRATDAAAWDGMNASIAASGLLRLATEPGPAVRAFLVPARTTAPVDAPVPQLGPVASPAWAVVSETGELMMLPRPADAFASAVKNLESWATYRLKLAITNNDSALHDDVSIEILRRDGGEWSAIEPDAAGGMRTVNVGDVIEIRVNNNGLEPLHIGLFDFRPTGEVRRLYPRGMTEPIDGGYSVMLGRGRGFRASWPAVFPFQPTPFGDAPLQAVETLKAFITTEPTDWSFFEQESASRSLEDGTAPQHPLHRLLLASTHGASRDLEAVPPDDWATVTLPFALREQRTTELASGEVATAGVTLRATGITGSAQVQDAARALRGDSAAPGAPLDAWLAASDVRTLQTIRLSGLGAPDAATPGPAPGVLTLSVKEPPAGWGQMVVATDDGGRVRWSFADEVVAGHDTLRSAPTGLRTFRITHDAAAGDRATRQVRVLAFPLVTADCGEVNDRFVARWEALHRPYTLGRLAADSVAGDMPLLAAPRAELAQGRTLLLVPGLFLGARDSFGALPRTLLDRLNQRYRGRVLAFDHPAASVDPRDNVRWLLAGLPPGASLDLDIVAWGRGGLVGRVIAERAAEFSTNASTVRVGNLVLAGPAGEWTAAAETHPTGCLDRFTSMLNASGGPPPGDAPAAILAAAKQAAVGAAAGLDGIIAMRADSDFASWLGSAPADRYTKASPLEDDASTPAGWLANTRVHEAIIDVLMAAPA